MKARKKEEIKLNLPALVAGLVIIALALYGLKNNTTLMISAPFVFVGGYLLVKA